MLRTNQNKKWLVLMMVIICSLVFIATARADWPQQDKLLALDGSAGDSFGISVSISSRGYVLLLTSAAIAGWTGLTSL